MLVGWEFWLLADWAKWSGFPKNHLYSFLNVVFNNFPIQEKASLHSCSVAIRSDGQLVCSTKIGFLCHKKSALKYESSLAVMCIFIRSACSWPDGPCTCNPFCWTERIWYKYSLGVSIPSDCAKPLWCSFPPTAAINTTGSVAYFMLTIYFVYKEPPGISTPDTPWKLTFSTFVKLGVIRRVHCVLSGCGSVRVCRPSSSVHVLVNGFSPIQVRCQSCRSAGVHCGLTSSVHVISSFIK